MTSLGVFGLVAGELSESALHDLVHERLRPLEEFDAAQDARLVETLDAYYSHKRKLASAADALHVHVNTLYRRLERVAELLGPEWDSPDESLQTALALRLRQLSRGGRPR
jgi:DNA-binding PucR family transcriptional regulator